MSNIIQRFLSILLLIVLPMCTLAGAGDVVARVGALTVTREELVETAYNLNYYGVLASDKDFRGALDYLLLYQKVPLLKAQEYGFDQLTGKGRTDLEAEGEKTFERYIDKYVDDKISRGIQDTRENRAALRQEAVDYWASYGLSKKYFVNSFITQAILQRLYTVIDLGVSEAEVEMHLNSLVEKEKMRFEGNLRDYEFSLYNRGDILWYRPEGYRKVALIFLPTPRQELNAWLSAKRTGRNDAVQKQFQLIESVAEEVEKVLQRLKAGESPIQISEDYEMPASVRGLWREDGFLIHRESVVWDTDIRETAFSVVTPDPFDYLGTTLTEDGVVMVCYLAESYAGATAFDDIMREMATEDIQRQKVEQQLEAWQSSYDIFVDQAVLTQIESEYN